MDTASLIYKVLSGQASAAEQRELKQWMAETPENRAEFEDMKLLWRTGNETEGDTAGVNEGFEKIDARVRADVHKRRWKQAVVKTAVIIVLGIVGFFVIDDVKARLHKAQNIQFQNVALQQAIGVIEDQYHIIIEVEDADLLRRRVTLARYDVKDGRRIVESLARALNLEATKLSHNRYQLRKAGGCQQ